MTPYIDRVRVSFNKPEGVILFWFLVWFYIKREYDPKKILPYKSDLLIDKDGRLILCKQGEPLGFLEDVWKFRQYIVVPGVVVFEDHSGVYVGDEIIERFYIGDYFFDDVCNPAVYINGKLWYTDGYEYTVVRAGDLGNKLIRNKYQTYLAAKQYYEYIRVRNEG